MSGWRCLAAVCVCVWVRTTDAQVFRFLPGDAYFQTEITKEIAERLSVPLKDDAITLNYSFGSAVIWDTYQGYESVEIQKLTKDRCRLIADVYRRIREKDPIVVQLTEKEGRERRVELNGVQMLIYNKGYDGTYYRIGLRYNENWPEEEQTFSIPQMFTSYPAYGSSWRRYVALDWKLSKEVNPLSTKLPAFGKQTPGQLENQPVVVDTKDVQFVMMPDKQLELLRQGTPDEVTGKSGWYYQIDGLDMTFHYLTSEGWKKHEVGEDPEAPLQSNE